MQLKQAIPFVGGLNRDDDHRFLPEGDYPYIRNARTGAPDSQQDEGLVVSLKAAEYFAKGPAYDTVNVYHLGVAVDMETQRAYVMLYDNALNKFIVHEYNSSTDTYDEILEVDSEGWGIGTTTKFIKPRVVNGNLIITDNVNSPKMINIMRARTSLNTGVGYAAGDKPPLWDDTAVWATGDYCFYIDRFYKALQPSSGIPYPPDGPAYWDDVCAITDAYASMDADVFLFESPPPLIAAIPSYQSDSNVKVNNLRGSIYQFSYRYVYMDYRKSTYAPPSEIASPDGEETPTGMFNYDVSRNNSLKITLAAPGPDVRIIEVIGRNSEDPYSWFIIDSVDVINENGDRTAGYDLTIDIFWYNDRVRQAVDQGEVMELFTYVPVRANMIEVIEGNRIVFADITEGHDGVRPLVTTQLSYSSLAAVETSYPMSASPVIKEYGPTGSPDHIIWVLSFRLPISGEVGATYRISVQKAGDPSPTTAEYTMVAGDAATYPTSVKNALIALMGSMEVATCPAWVPPQNICAYERQLHESITPYSGWTYFGEVASASYLNKYKHLKFGATHPHALIYRDKGGRIASLVRDNNFDIAIPFYTEDTNANMNTIPVVDMYFNHKPPDWAESFEILYAGNDSIINPLQLKATGWIVDGDYWRFQIADTFTHMYDERSGWKVPTYQWTEGDRVRLIGLSDGIDSVTEENDVLVDLEITKVEDVGGTDYLFVQATTDITIPSSSVLYIIEIYSPVKELSETVYYTTGMTFLVSTDGNGHKYHEGDTDQIISVSGTVTTPGRVRLTSHDVWKFRRINYDNAGSSTFTFWAESRIYSDWSATQQMTSQGLPIPEVEGAGQVTLQKRYRWGGKLIPDSKVNNIANFDYNDLKDMQEQFGPITGIREVGFVLKIIQHHKISSAYIGRTETHDGAGNAILAISTDVIGTTRASQEDYGCQDPESIEVHGRHMYFWDQKYGVIIRDAPNGMIPISDAKMKRYFLDKADDIKTSTPDIQVIMGYNAKADELWVSFRVYWEQAETVIFSERNKRWRFFADNYVDEYWTIGRRFFAEYKLRTNEYDSEAATQYLNWSDIEDDSEVEVRVVSNIERMKQKIFQAIAVYSNLAPVCEQVLIPIEASEAMKVTELHDANWNRREGIWYGQILRDINSQGTFVDDMDRKLNGRVMRGEYAIFTFKWTDTIVQLKLFSVMVLSTPSERSR